jgi:hypothetical protein
MPKPLPWRGLKIPSIAIGCVPRRPTRRKAASSFRSGSTARRRRCGSSTSKPSISLAGKAAASIGLSKPSSPTFRPDRQAGHGVVLVFGYANSCREIRPPTLLIAVLVPRVAVRLRRCHVIFRPGELTRRLSPCPQLAPSRRLRHRSISSGLGGVATFCPAAREPSGSGRGHDLAATTVAIRPPSVRRGRG